MSCAIQTDGVVGADLGRAATMGIDGAGSGLELLPGLELL